MGVVLVGLVLALRRRRAPAVALAALLMSLTVRATPEAVRRRTLPFDVPTATLGALDGVTFRATPQDLLDDGMTLLLVPNLIRRNETTLSLGQAAAIGTFADITPGSRVGEFGARPCLGVLIAGSNGVAVVAHFQPAGQDIATALRQELERTCIVDPVAYAFSEALNDVATGRNLRDTIDALDLMGIPFAGFSPSDNLYVDSAGRLSRNDATAYARLDLVGRAHNAAARALLAKAPTPARRAALRARAITPVDTTANCVEIRGGVVGHCAGSAAEPYVRQTIAVERGGGGVGCPDRRNKIVLDDAGAFVKVVDPLDPALRCGALRMNVADIAVSSATSRIPVDGVVQLGVLEVPEAFTSITGEVTMLDGSAPTVATVSYFGLETRPDNAGDFSFATDWRDCDVRVVASAGSNFTIRSATARPGVTDVGTLSICPEGKVFCGDNGGSCVDAGTCPVRGAMSEGVLVKTVVGDGTDVDIATESVECAPGGGGGGPYTVTWTPVSGSPAMQVLPSATSQTVTFQKRLFLGAFSLTRFTTKYECTVTDKDGNSVVAGRVVIGLLGVGNAFEIFDMGPATGSGQTSATSSTLTAPSRPPDETWQWDTRQSTFLGGAPVDSLPRTAFNPPIFWVNDQVATSTTMTYTTTPQTTTPATYYTFVMGGSTGRDASGRNTVFGVTPLIPLVLTITGP